MITGVAHACFVVPDLERAVGFYRDKLGLTLAFEFKNDKGRRVGVYLRAGRRTFIELFEGKAGPAADGQSYSHICLEVDDIAATVEALHKRGVQVSGVALGSDQTYQAWLADPDGNRIELHAYTPESWQDPWLTGTKKKQVAHLRRTS